MTTNKKKSAASAMLKGISTDKSKEVEGTEVQLSNGCFAKVARWGNPEHAKITNKLRRPHIMRNGKPKASLTDDVANKMMAEGMADAILLGWKLDQKDAFEYDREEALELLADKDFLLEIFEISQDRALFLAEEEDAAAKNS